MRRPPDLATLYALYWLASRYHSGQWSTGYLILSRTGTIMLERLGIARPLEVETLCQRVAILRKGALIADESLETLRQRARQRVRIVFRDGTAPEQVPDFLALDERDGSIWCGILVGELEDFLSFAAGHSIEDVTIEPPDLESLFQSYYRGDAS